MIDQTTAAVQDTFIGDYVRRTATAKGTYVRGVYDHSTKRYALQDAEDMNRVIYVKRDTVLYIGFTY